MYTQTPSHLAKCREGCVVMSAWLCGKVTSVGLNNRQGKGTMDGPR